MIDRGLDIGYMVFPDLAKATAEFTRVLKPGGRICSSVWVKPGENSWTTIAMPAIAAEAVLAPPDPDGPNMFRCAAPGHVSALYEAAGLRDIAEWDVHVELVTRSPAQYWEMISEHVSPAVARLRGSAGARAEREVRHRQCQQQPRSGKVRIPAWPAASSARSRDTPRDRSPHRHAHRTLRGTDCGFLSSSDGPPRRGRAAPTPSGTLRLVWQRR